MKESLNDINVPVTIIATLDDEWLKPETHAQFFAEHIPNSEIVMYPKGGHFLFLSCDPITRIADWFIDQFDLCGRGFDVDRKAHQSEIASLAVDFFDKHLTSNEQAL
jgi:hypothetical protein